MIPKAMATHIRAGEITAQLISCQNYSYRFFITGYTDTGSDVLFGGGEIKYGDGATDSFETGNPDIFEDLGDEIALNIFVKEHTFPGPGIYKISFREFNRNEGIVNMDNSVNTPFYIETVLVIDPFLGCNNTPVLVNPPLEKACVGVAFLHNAGAVDPDGDSLSYEFTVPKMDQDIPVVNYRFPNIHDIAVYDAKNEDQTGPASFTIDPITGDLVWDAPGGEGEYNMAFIVREWRKIDGEWYNMGYVTRDMQVIVEDCDNERPEIIPPPDTCVIAGTTLETDIFAEDPDGHDIIMSAFGDVFETANSPASYAPFPPSAQPSPATLTFNWQTNCGHINPRPYQVKIKALDQPPTGEGPKLADFYTWFVTVIGPPPEGLGASQGAGNLVNLSWNNYECSNASEIEIWRRVDSNPFEPEHCELGMPENAGYELIDIVDIGQSTYADNNNGLGLEFGATYCYRLVAVFESLGGMKSVVSDETCVEIKEYEGIFGSLMTNVSVEETDTENGEIFIRWTSPFDIDQSKYPPPYSYELYRGEGFTSSNPTLISGGKITDTIFTDIGRNTRDLVYNYTVVVYDNNQLALDTTLSASSVRLDLGALAGAMELQWSATVPWSNVAADYPMHLIYRDNVDPTDQGKLVLIDSVNVLQNGFRYIDDGSATGDNGLIDTQEYCYYVVTRGVYGNAALPEPFLNQSQIICAQPNDTIPPCPPQSLEIGPDCEDYLRDRPCDFSNFFNELTWSDNTGQGCDDDIRSYNIYFSESGEEGTFTLIDNVNVKSYVHDGLLSFKGCYMISAIDRSGNESEMSEVVCNDNCPNYVLPNIFTPNNDGFNEDFQAFNTARETPEGSLFYICPRFVESVEFTVYNRYGKEVYSTSNDPEKSILIKWDGRTNDGKLVSSGVYYYLAKVTFDVLDPGSRQQEIKGWVQVFY
jgi:hypothetical protein